MPLAIIIALVTVTGGLHRVAVVAVAAQPAAEFEGQEAGLAADPAERDRRDVAGHRARRRGRHLHLQRHAGDDLRPDPHPVRDGPRRHAAAAVPRVNPRTLTPVANTVIVAVVVSLLAGLLPIDFLAEMTSIGTLVAFLVVSVGVIDPAADGARPAAGLQGAGLSGDADPVDPRLPLDHPGPAPVTILAFVIWVAVAMVFYFAYGIRHSAARPGPDAGRDDAA